MEKRPTVTEFLAHVFMIFGIIIFLLNILCLIFGEDAKEFSSIFSCGATGISVTTSFQFLLASAVTVVLRFIFMTDAIIKKMATGTRIVSMFASVTVSVILMIICFGWFPVGNFTAWVMFGISLAASCTVSTFLSLLNEKQENEKLNEALRKAKENL